MDKSALAKEINDVLAVEARSLMEHFRQATPHVTAATYRIWQDIKRLSHRDSDHVLRLTSLLARLNLPERPRPFPLAVGYYHYLSIDRVLPLLIAEKQAQLAAYDRAIRHCGREQDVIVELESLRADNLSELMSLQSMEVRVKKGTAMTYARDVGRSPDLNNAANAAVASRVLAAARARQKPGDNGGGAAAAPTDPVDDPTLQGAR